jgi:hypothetical protein
MSRADTRREMLRDHVPAHDRFGPVPSRRYPNATAEPGIRTSLTHRHGTEPSLLDFPSKPRTRLLSLSPLFVCARARRLVITIE